MIRGDRTRPRNGRATSWCFGHRVLLLTLSSFLCCGSLARPASAQVTRHPEKVEIKPSKVDYPDALRVWGGIMAGPGGNLAVVAPDGTLSVATSIPDGSITFAKWSQNSCSLSNIPQWDGTQWVCSTVSGAGGLDPTSDAIITGKWRFSQNTVFGDAVTPQQLVHVYKSGASAAVRIEQGGSSWWDLTTSGNNFSIGTSGGPQATFNTTGLGLGKTPAARLDVNGTAIMTGLAVNGPISSHLNPLTPDTYDIGSAAFPWRQSFISQLNAVIFNQQTATLLGGFTIIAKDAGKFDAVVNPADSTIDFGKAMTPGHFVLVRGIDTSGSPRSEYFQVGALQSGFRYSVTRNLAFGSATPTWTWPDSTSFMVLGTTGDGRIELKAYNTPQIGFLTQGAAYNALTEPLRIGALDGMPSVPAGKFGLYVGNTTTAGMSFYDATLTVRGEIRATSGYFGTSATTGVTVDGEGVTVGSSSFVRSPGMSYAAGTGFWFGNDAGSYKMRVGSTTNYVRWDGTSTLEIAGRITANSGTIGSFNIGTYLYTGSKTLFNDANTGVHIGGDGIGLGPYPTFSVSSTGFLTSTAGTIGVFNINSHLYTGSKTAYNDGVAGVHIGSDGLGLGANVFMVSAAGLLTATNANITGTITATSGNITAALQANSITAAMLQAGSVTAGKVAAGSITSTEIAAGTITAGNIGAGQITAGKIAADAIVSQNIQAGEVRATNIGAGQVTASKISVTQLSAIAADMGSITAGTITSGTFKTSDGLMILNNNGMFLQGGPGSAGWIQWQADGASIGISGSNITVGSPGGGAGTVNLAGAVSMGSPIKTQMGGGGNRRVCVDNAGTLYPVCGTCSC
jgi:hypothetical protein